MKREEALELLENGEIDIEDLDEKLRDDEEFMLICGDDDSCLRVASKRLRDNSDFMIRSMVQYGSDALKYASKELKEDKEFFLEAVKTMPQALEFASEKLKKDSDILKRVEEYDEDRYDLEEVPSNFHINQKYLKISELKKDIKEVPYGLAWLDEEFRNNKEVVLAAVKSNGYTLKYASEELKNDKDVVMTAIKEEKYAYKYADEELLKDPDIMVEMIKTGTYDFKKLSEEELEEFSKNMEENNRAKKQKINERKQVLIAKIYAEIEEGKKLDAQIQEAKTNSKEEI